MSESKHTLLLKAIAVAIAYYALSYLSDGLGSDRGLLGKLFVLVAGLVMLLTAVGFYRRQGWAFLLVSLGLLVGFWVHSIGLIVAVDEGAGVSSHLVRLAVTIAGIGYLGRWSMERRFRPHLDHAHAG